jgi:hypothetical protein
MPSSSFFSDAEAILAIRPTDDRNSYRNCPGLVTVRAAASSSAIFAVVVQVSNGSWSLNDQRNRTLHNVIRRHTPPRARTIPGRRCAGTDTYRAGYISPARRLLNCHAPTTTASPASSASSKRVDRRKTRRPRRSDQVSPSGVGAATTAAAAVCRSHWAAARSVGIEGRAPARVGRVPSAASCPATVRMLAIHANPHSPFVSPRLPEVPVVYLVIADSLVAGHC